MHQSSVENVRSVHRFPPVVKICPVSSHHRRPDLLMVQHVHHTTDKVHRGNIMQRVACGKPLHDGRGEDVKMPLMMMVLI